MKFYRLAGKWELFRGCGMVHLGEYDSGTTVAADMSPVKKEMRSLGKKLRQIGLRHSLRVERVTLHPLTSPRIMGMFQEGGFADSLIESLEVIARLDWEDYPDSPFSKDTSD